MPSTWEKPLATSLAFLWPSDFRSNTYWFFITLRPLGGSTSSKTLRLCRESNSSQHTCFHSFCASLGIFIMSLKVHSRTLAVSGVSKSGGTALARVDLEILLPLPSLGIEVYLHHPLNLFAYPHSQD